jgi:malonyl-CoA O-methyltransferase
VDKELIRRRFEANFQRYHRLALVQRKICAELGEMAAGLCGAQDVAAGLELGVGTGFLTEHLMSTYPGARWTLNDISAAAETFVAKYANGNTAYLWGDAEEIAFPGGLDMIAAASTVQWFGDLPAFAAKAARATRPGGWLLLSTFGPLNFREIRSTTGEGLDYYTLDELREIFEQAGYRIHSLAEYTCTLDFDTPIDVLHHIRATGVNSLSKARWGRGRLAAFEKDYRERFSNGRAVTLTYHPQLMVAQKA